MSCPCSCKSSQVESFYRGCLAIMSSTRRQGVAPCRGNILSLIDTHDSTSHRFTRFFTCLFVSYHTKRMVVVSSSTSPPSRSTIFQADTQDASRKLLCAIMNTNSPFPSSSPSFSSIRISETQLYSRESESEIDTLNLDSSPEALIAAAAEENWICTGKLGRSCYLLISKLSHTNPLLLNQ